MKYAWKLGNSENLKSEQTKNDSNLKYLKGGFSQLKNNTSDFQIEHTRIKCNAWELLCTISDVEASKINVIR
jgi:hypothetical protein